MFAQLYQAHHAHYQDDMPFWLELARRQGNPMLELGCGTGRVLLSLARAGWTAFGLDHDADMLGVLQQQAGPEPDASCPIFLADMGAFHLAREFALILLPCNTFSTLPQATRGAMLALVRSHLTSTGLFAVSLPNPALLAHLPRQQYSEFEEIFPHPVDGEPVQVSSAWQREERSILITWHYDHLLPDGRVERISRQARHALQPIESYIEEFRQAGLRIEATYGDFDKSTLTPESPNLILLAGAGK